MKETKIPFNLDDYYKEDHEVETRGSADEPPKKVRILCTDFSIDSKKLIIAAISRTNSDTKECYEEIKRYQVNGKCGDEDSPLDLMLVTREFEDGDIIFASLHNSTQCFIFIFGDVERPSIAWFTGQPWSYHTNSEWSYDTKRLATESEKQLLFNIFAKEGKRWNAEKKCIEPLCSLKPFDKVLVRNYDRGKWFATFLSNIESNEFRVCDGTCYTQCIPYNNETKYLLGTNKNPKEV